MKKYFNYTCLMVINLLLLILLPLNYANASDKQMKVSSESKVYLLKVITDTTKFIEKKSLISTIKDGKNFKSYAIDSAGNVKLVDNNSTTIALGFDTYKSLNERKFSPIEIEVLQGLDFNPSLLWSHINLKSVPGEDPLQLKNSFPAQVRGLSNYNLNSTTLEVSENKVTGLSRYKAQDFESFRINWLEGKKNGTTLIKVKDGIIANVVRTFAGRSVTFTITPLSTTITPPSNPTIEYGDFKMDPRYVNQSESLISKAKLSLAFQYLANKAVEAGHRKLFDFKIEDQVFKNYSTELTYFVNSIQLSHTSQQGELVTYCATLSNDSLPLTRESIYVQLKINNQSCNTN